MSVKTITESQALELIRNDFENGIPYLVINDAGRAAVAQFVSSYAADPARHALDAWYSDAERAANNDLLDESIIIEMRGMDTASRNPVTLRMDRSDFDWVIAD